MEELNQELTKQTLVQLQQLLTWGNQMSGLTGEQIDTFRRFGMLVANELKRLSSTLETALMERDLQRKTYQELIDADVKKQKEKSDENQPGDAGNGSSVPGQKEGSGASAQDEEEEKPA